jgi:flagellar hook-associated protein 1 FlgK
MISDALNIAASALAAQQQAIDVVSQNVSNVNTAGYSRQTPELAALAPTVINGLSIGSGVSVDNIQRAANPVLNQAIAGNDSQVAYWQAMQQGLSGLDATFGSIGGTTLNSSLDSFFQSFQTLANNPQSAASQQAVVTSAQGLATQITGMDQQLTSQENGSYQQIPTMLDSVNSLLDKIASLNANISNQYAISTSPPSTLLDQRDAAINALSKLIPVQQVSTATASTGGIMLQTPGGDMLVSGDTAQHLALGSSSTATQVNIVYQGTNTPVTGLDQGGQLGGTVATNSKIAGYLTQLNSLAANLAFSVNQLQASGTGSSAVSSYTAGQVAANPAGNTTAVNLDTNVPFASQIQSGSFKIYVLNAAGSPVNAGGTTITVTAGTSTLAGIAGQINAAGVTGLSASISNGKLTISGGSNRVVFGSDSSNFLAAYEVNGFFHGSNAADLSVAAAVQADPGRVATTAIDPTTSTVPAGGNGVAQAIYALSQSAVSIDGTTAASFSTRASGLAGTYGQDTAGAKQQLSAKQAVGTSLANQWQSISGVNLDQEMVSMLQFQQAYQASAKIITTTNSMLSSLMGVIQ